MSEAYNPEEDGVWVCTECGSPINNPANNVWIQEGSNPPCKACGGVTIHVWRPSDVPEAIRQHNLPRNIGHMDDTPSV